MQGNHNNADTLLARNRDRCSNDMDRASRYLLRSGGEQAWLRLRYASRVHRSLGRLSARGGSTGYTPSSARLAGAATRQSTPAVRWSPSAVASSPVFRQRTGRSLAGGPPLRTALSPPAVGLPRPRPQHQRRLRPHRLRLPHDRLRATVERVLPSKRGEFVAARRETAAQFDEAIDGPAIQPGRCPRERK